MKILWIKLVSTNFCPGELIARSNWQIQSTVVEDSPTCPTLCAMRLPVLLAPSRSDVRENLKRCLFSYRGYRRERRSAFATVTTLIVVLLIGFSVNHHKASKNAASPWISFYKQADTAFYNLEWIPALHAQNCTDIAPPLSQPHHSTTSFLTFSHLAQQPSSPFSKKSSPIAKACVFYDAPPRTGAEVIAPTLRECLVRKGFQMLESDVGPPSQRMRAVWPASLDGLLASALQGRSMSSAGGSQHLKVASVTSPLVFSKAALAAVSSVCESVLYVSSARPMAHRLADALWDDVRAERSENDPLALSVAAAVDPVPLARVERAYAAFPWVAPVDERHPLFAQFRQRDFLPRDLGEYAQGSPLPTAFCRAPSPDYVITEANFSAQLQQLLQALGCQPVPLGTGLLSWMNLGVSWLFSRFLERTTEVGVPGATQVKIVANFTAPFYVARRLSGRDVVLDRMAKMSVSNDSAFETLVAVAQHANDDHGLRLARKIADWD